MSDYVTRFSVRQRAEHLLVMSLFLTLSFTGLPQKFYTAGWAQAIILGLGGIGTVRLIHRTAGVLFSIVTVVHLTTVIGLVATRRTAMSLVPTRRDFTDAIVTLKYYLGLVDRHPEFDRFDYRQKWEYWGLVLGAVVVISTGIILMFPIVTATWLPGQVIPASKLAHSNEGLMAFLVVVVWHIYNAHFSPDVFPFDRTIFTGQISRERMEKEHSLEWARLTGNQPTHHS